MTDGLQMKNNGIKFLIDEPPVTGAKIKVIGVGGGGSNAVNRSQIALASDGGMWG